MKISDKIAHEMLILIPLSHLCGLSTVARGSRVYGFPQVFRGSETSFCMITATWRFLRFGAFLIAERRPRSNVIRSTRMTYGNHGVITLYTRMAAVSSRIRAVYFTNIHGGLTDIYGYSRWLCEYSRFLHGFRGGTTVITLSTVLIRCVDGSGTAEGHGNLRFGQPYRTAAVVVHFNAAFLVSFVDNS